MCCCTTCVCPYIDTHPPKPMETMGVKGQEMPRVMYLLHFMAFVLPSMFSVLCVFLSAFDVSELASNPLDVDHHKSRSSWCHAALFKWTKVVTAATTLWWMANSWHNLRENNCFPLVSVVINGRDDKSQHFSINVWTLHPLDSNICLNRVCVGTDECIFGMNF